MGEEWIAAAGDPEAGDPEVPAILSSRGIDKFRATAVGGVLAAGLLGLRDVLDGPIDDGVAIVETLSGDPPRRERIVLRLDPDDPSDSIVMIRDWMPLD